MVSTPRTTIRCAGSPARWWLRLGLDAARVDLAGHAIEAVATTTADGLTVRGWLVRAFPESHDSRAFG